MLLFDSGLIIPVTKHLSDSTIEYLGSSVVGVMAQIEPTELNELTAEITRKSAELDAREAALKEREISTRDFGTSEATDYSTFIMSAILFILTALIMLNYVLDWNRARTLYAAGDPA
jgi:hypothetical protein